MSEMSNQEWEVVQRVKMYRKKTLDVLHAGGGIEDLTKITDMGMNLKLETVKELVEDILSKEIPSEEKAQLIAEKLVES